MCAYSHFLVKVTHILERGRTGVTWLIGGRAHPQFPFTVLPSAFLQTSLTVLQSAGGQGDEAGRVKHHIFCPHMDIFCGCFITCTWLGV